MYAVVFMEMNRRNNFQNNLSNNAIRTELARAVEETLVAKACVNTTENQISVVQVQIPNRNII